MSLTVVAVIALVAFVAGVLVGRRHPAEANVLAAIAQRAADQAKVAADRIKG